MKQCKEHYEAIERGDAYMAHITYVPEPRMPLFIREMQERSEENWKKLKAEEEYLDKLPKELLDLEIEHQINKRCQNKDYQEKPKRILRKREIGFSKRMALGTLLSLILTILINLASKG